MTMSRNFTVRPAPQQAASRFSCLACGVDDTRGGCTRFHLTGKRPGRGRWQFVGILLEKSPRDPWIRAQHDLDRLPLDPTLYYAESPADCADCRRGMSWNGNGLGPLPWASCVWRPTCAAGTTGPTFSFPISLLTSVIGDYGSATRFVFVSFSCSRPVSLLLPAEPRPKARFRSGVLGGVLLILMALTGWADLVLVPSGCGVAHLHGGDCRENEG